MLGSTSRCIHNVSMSLDEYLQQRDEKFLGKDFPKFKGAPTWFQKGIKEMRSALMHPDMAAEVGRLMLCDAESLVQCRGELIYAFVNTYDLSVESAERLVNFAITKNKLAMQPLVPMAGIHFFSNEKKTAGVITPKTSRKLYDHIQAEYGHERPSTIYLRVGPSSTKDDVIDYVDKYWDKYVKPLRDAELHKDKQARNRPKVLRDTAVYALWKDGKSYAEIQKLVNDKYNDSLTDPDLRKIVERTKPRTQLLANFSKQFDELYPRASKVKKKLIIKTFDSGNDNELFLLEIV